MGAERGIRRQAVGVGCGLGLTLMAGAAAAQTQELRFPSYNLYGLPGLIDMPTAEMAPDGTLGITVGRFGNTNRATLSFQILPRVTGAFRYTLLQEVNPFVPGVISPTNGIGGVRDGDYYDRSFDIRFQLLKEGTYLPAVTVGLQDFIGTGLYGGEYLVATKEITPDLRVTGGLGWGRLASLDPFATVGTRPTEQVATGGQANYDRFFRGDVAFFGGVSYDVTDRFRLSAEYSSDDYVNEQNRTSGFDKTSPFNFGLDYTFQNGTQLSLYHAYGTTVGVQLSLLTDLKTAPVPGGNEGGPLPVRPRPAQSAVDLGWTGNSVAQEQSRKSLADLLDEQGIDLEGMTLDARSAAVRIQNRRYNAVPQAVGRTARAMTRALPGSVEQFTIVLTEDGLPGSAVVVNRSDIERLEFEPATAIYDRARVVDSVGRTPPAFAEAYPRFDWALTEYIATSTFDPDEPLRIDYGVRAEADLDLAPGLELSGAVIHKFGGNIGDAVANAASPTVPAVRTNFPEYARTDTSVDRLTLAHYGRPAEDVYSRITAGYLERMYAGVSGEVLWKPVASRLGLGAELNYIQRRDADGGFGLRTNVTPSGEIPNVNGHVSAYYDIGYGFHTQLDVGRYLAGDYGATVSLDREFGNGWKVGAYATFTELSADEFGEGSFDKGIRITVPLNWALGTANRQTRTATIRPITRDGGARLNVSDRLYGRVRQNHEPELAKTWGRFWR